MESDFIDWLRAQLPASPAAEIGVGDDAAVLALRGDPRLVVTSDMLMDGVDFQLARCDAARAGRKALAVNLSDLAAMAAQPLAAVVSLALPRRGGLQLAQQLYAGLLPLAAEFEVAVVGGDTNSWDRPLAISITALGLATPRGVLRRDGARPGDEILVTGDFGGSILGRHFDFAPRLREALLLHERYRLTAGIDVSDGLSLDLARLAAASGCGAAIELDRVPVSVAAEQLAARDQAPALEHALGDGEDFELILAAPPESAGRMLADQPLDVRLTRIGTLVDSPGLWRVADAGRLEPLEPRGYQHSLDEDLPG